MLFDDDSVAGSVDVGLWVVGARVGRVDADDLAVSDVDVYVQLRGVRDGYVNDPFVVGGVGVAAVDGPILVVGGARRDVDLEVRADQPAALLVPQASGSDRVAASAQQLANERVGERDRLGAFNDPH